jgi:hypothetical protein
MEHDPTSEEIDRLLDESPQEFKRLEPNPDLRVHVEVPLDAATLRALEERADREGRPFTDVVSDIIRAGAAAA